MSDSFVELIDLAAIKAAQTLIKGRLHRTPVMGSSFLSQELGLQIYFKMELFQKTGSFKPRGVLNKLHHLSTEKKQKGVISLSAGNHAQALAWGATQEGLKATLVMPAYASLNKIAATRAYGGEVVQTSADLLATCLQIQKERDLTLVHPFDDPLIIAGQGTVGLELIEDLPDLEAVIVGIGGGGLISGMAAALKAVKPTIKVIGVEPEGAAAMSQSVALGRPVHLDQVHTIADGLAAPFAGVHTLAHVQKYVDQLVTVSDAQIPPAMRLILERCKVLAEPAAAATLAALLSGRVTLPPGTRVACVLSGGNIDCERLKSLM